MNFVHYIPHQNSDSLTQQVYLTLKQTSEKALTYVDCPDLNIDYTDDLIKDIEKSAWKKFIKKELK